MTTAHTDTLGARWDTLEKQLTSLSRTGMKLGLERVQRALDETGNPERAAPVVHVAGSNGKGSTCAFIERACRDSGLRTALYTSPHLERFTERFRIDGEPVPEEDVLAVHESLETRIPWAFSGPDALTFFERVTVLGFHVLARAKPDVLVCEVGLGGRLDATNVVQPIAACVTPLGLEHKDFLGDTLAAIAGEKAGIFKRGAAAVSSSQEPEALAVLERAAARVRATLSLEGREFRTFEQHGHVVYESDRGVLDGLTLGLRGAHQMGNAAVALRALEHARDAGLKVTTDGIAHGLARTTWPGRLESLSARRENGTTVEVLLDGAHNPPAARSLANAVPSLVRGRPLHLLFALLDDKDFDAVLGPIASLCDRVTATTARSPRALSADRLAAGARRIHASVSAEPDVATALRTALDALPDDGVLLVAGSLYLVGDVRARLHGTRATGAGELLRESLHRS